MPDYSQGKIYRLTCNDLDLVYYGSTTMTLSRRLNRHQSSFRRWLKDNNLKCEASKILFEIGEVEIELVLEYPCNSKRELEEVEETYIANDECVNMKRAYMTKENELDNIRKCRNSDKRRAVSNKYMKEYYKTDKSKEYRKNYMKEYYQRNSEYLKQLNKNID
jgi:hypothetical protein